jgi:membrane protein
MAWIKSFGGLLKESFKEWQKDKASRLAAALAYYTIFSLAPLVLVVLTILGWIYRDGNSSKLFLTQIVGLVGESGGEVFESIIEAANQPAKSTWAAIVGIATAIFVATGVFVQLKDALNAAWGITEVRFKGLKGMVRVRAVSLTAILVIGFLLLVSLFVNTGLTALTSKLSSDDAILAILLQVFNQVLSIGLIAILFAFMYKFLPDIKIAWKDVWVGALFTSVLFNIGKLVIGLYLGNSNVGSSFGTAGSILVILLWVYYSAQIILFGAEFTQVYSEKYGSKVKTGTPKRHPEAVEVALDEKGVPIVAIDEEKTTNNPQLDLAAKPLVTEQNPYSSVIALGVIALSLIWRVARLINKPRS